LTLVSIQILRGLAALAVATQHALHDAETLEARLGRPFHALDALPWNAGVDVFFVISGLIMVHSSRGLAGTPGAGGEFLKRRLARIVPLYWAATSLYLAIALIAPTLLNREYLAPGYILASYLFVPAARPDGLVQPFYPLGWTLNFEMLFYAVFALAIGLPLRQAAALVLASLAGLVVAGQWLAPWPQPLAFWTDPIILEFAAGVGLGVLRAEGVRLPGWARGGLAIAGLLGFGLVAVAPDLLSGVPRTLAYGGPALLLVAAAALGPAGEERGGPSLRFGTVLGDSSYALYLLHPFAIRLAREVFWQTGFAHASGPLLFVVVALLASIVGAILVFRFVERPLTHRARAWLGGSQGRPSAPATRQPIRPGG
jgi:peptidoglycan/LPS O-acetylase OafA/YrhL